MLVVSSWSYGLLRRVWSVCSVASRGKLRAFMVCIWFIELQIALSDPLQERGCCCGDIARRRGGWRAGQDV